MSWWILSQPGLRSQSQRTRLQLPFIIIPVLVTALSLNPARVLARDSVGPGHSSTVTFLSGDTAHIVENLPSISTLSYNALFWLALDTLPEIISYLALQIHVHNRLPGGAVRPLKTSPAYPLVIFNGIVRNLLNGYKWIRLGEFALAQATPAISQTYRWLGCSVKTGTIPVYIMDSALARAFTLKIRFNDLGAPYVVFHALRPNPETSQKLPRAWQKLFEQLHKLPDPTLYASIRTDGQLTLLCLGKTSGQECDSIVTVQYPTREARSVFWDIEMAGQWCPKSTLKGTEPGYSIFSTPVIDAMANILATPEHSTTLLLLFAQKALWQGNAATFSLVTRSDYQVGWSETGLNPASAGYMVLAPQGSPLTPESLAHGLSHWHYWINSYQKHWSATPLQWLVTLSLNQFSVKIREHIHVMAMDLIHKTCTSPPAEWPSMAPAAAVVSEPLEQARYGLKALTARMGNHPGPSVPPSYDHSLSVPTEGAGASASITNPPGDSSWGFTGQNVFPKDQWLLARSIVLHLSDRERKTGYYGSQTETSYLQSQHPGPKPATLLLPGVPIQLYLRHFDLILLLVAPPDRVLAAYKENCDSCADSDLDSSFFKRQHGLLSLAWKLHEINQRRYPLLQDHSWGHIGQDGQPAPPKPSGRPEKYYTSLLTENKVILSSYSIQDIQGIIITENMPLLSQADNLEPVDTLLAKKQAFEQALGLLPLPVYFYNQRLGRITGSIRPDPDALRNLKNTLLPIRENACLNSNHCNPPAFFGTVSFDENLRSVLNHLVSAVQKPDQPAFTVDQFNQWQTLIVNGQIDEAFFKSLANYPQWLMAPIRLPGQDRQVGTGRTEWPATPLKILAYMAPSATTRQGAIGQYQKRSRLVDQVIKLARLEEPFSRCPVSPFDVIQNPYAALNWITSKGCGFAPWDSGETYIRAAQSCMGALDGDQARREYFNEVVMPLFKELLKKGKLTQSSLSDAITDSAGLLIKKLLKLAYLHHEEAGLRQPEYIVGRQDIISHSLFYPERATITEIKNSYGLLVTLAYLYFITYDPSSLVIWSAISALESCFYEVTQSIGSPVSEVQAEAFYPLEESVYQTIVQNANDGVITVIKQAIQGIPMITMPTSEWIKAIGQKELKLIFAVGMQDPQSRNIMFMVSLIDQPPDVAAIIASKSPLSTENSREMELAMARPCHLRPSMAAPVDKQLQQVLEHYYLNPNPVHIQGVLDGYKSYDPDALWRQHHGIDHVARTVVILEATVQLHKQYKPEYTRLFADHPDLARLLPLAMVYHDAGEEVVDKALEETLAARMLERDLEGTGVSSDTIQLVVSALKNKNVNTMYPVPDDYIPDHLVSQDERLVRRLLRLPDSVDIARVRTISDEFSFFAPADMAGATIDDSTYSWRWMDLDPDLIIDPAFMADWVALMKTAVFWASLTGASPDSLGHSAPETLMPYPMPDLVAWTREISRQRQRVISRAPDSLGYVRELLNDIVRLNIAWEAGRTIKTLHQLRQINLPGGWTTLDSFLHFTENRKARLQPVMDFWQENPFTPHPGTLTHARLSRPGVIQALARLRLSAKQVKRQRDYNPVTGEPVFENTWEVEPQ